MSAHGPGRLKYSLCERDKIRDENNSEIRFVCAIAELKSGVELFLARPFREWTVKSDS